MGEFVYQIMGPTCNRGGGGGMQLTMQRLGKGFLDCQEKGVSMAGEMIE